jgi:iron complex transport system permease protein
MKGPVTKSSLALSLVISAIVTAVVMLLCMMVGSGIGYGISFGWPGNDIFEARVFPVVAAAIVGAALAASGVVLQSMLRNPLADPLILGIASGANVAAVIWMLCSGVIMAAAIAHHLPLFLLPSGAATFAGIGALISLLTVFALARRRGTAALEPVTLLLVGIIVSAFNGAATVLLLTLAPLEKEHAILNYLMGFIDEGVTRDQLLVSLVVFLFGWTIAFFSAKAMNIASFSDEEITSMGVRLSRLRTLAFISASVMTAAAIFLAGPIGFVGLICPHICRTIFGPDHRQLLTTAPFAGAIFLMTAYALVHGTPGIFHTQIPIGVVTALCGGPFFLILLRKRGVWNE